MLALPKCALLMRESFHKEKTMSTKTSFADVVTDTDKNIEQGIINCLKAKYPNHGFVSEESVKGKLTMTNEPMWVIDPIDGTTNFIHRFPQCAISIAFFLNKEVQIGVVFNPITDHVFSAIKGQGAFLNGKTIHGSGITDLSICQVVTEFGSSRDPTHLQMKTNNMLSVVEKANSIRCLGSSALDTCYVANGSCDVFYAYGTHIWDIAAGVLIAREAGCFVLDPHGGEFDFLNRRILVAATYELAEKFLPLLQNVEYDAE